MTDMVNPPSGSTIAQSEDGAYRQHGEWEPVEETSNRTVPDKQCPECGGRGAVPEIYIDGRNCPVCHGTGRVSDEPSREKLLNALDELIAEAEQLHQEMKKVGSVEHRERREYLRGLRNARALWEETGGDDSE